MLYQMQEGTFELKGKWHDRTIHMLIIEKLPVSNVNIVVTRDLMSNEELAARIEKLRVEMKEKFTLCKFLKDTAGKIDGRPSHFFEISWIDNGKPLHQIITFIHDRDMLLTLTATSPAGMDAVTRKYIVDAMTSFRFRDALTA